MTFKSSSVRKAGKNKLVAKGLLSIKGHARELELPITLLGTQEIPEPMRQMLAGTQEVASFAAATSIGRRDFEVGVGSWAQTLVVGGEVDIEIVVEAHRR